MEQSTPVLVPGVGSSYKNGWVKLKKYFLELFLIGIIFFVISELFAIPSFISLANSGLSGYAARASQPFTVFDFLSIPFGLLVGIPLEYGISFVYLKAARGDKLEIKDMFEGFRNYWNSILANLLVAAIIIIGFILLIIPGVIFALKLSFTPYLVVDRKMKVIEAVKESWHMTDGHTGQIFLIGLLGIPITIVGLLALLVGIIPAAMWVSLASASLYHAVSLTRTTPAPATP